MVRTVVLTIIGWYGNHFSAKNCSVGRLFWLAKTPITKRLCLRVHYTDIHTYTRSRERGTYDCIGPLFLSLSTGPGGIRQQHSWQGCFIAVTRYLKVLFHSTPSLNLWCSLFPLSTLFIVFRFWNCDPSVRTVLLIPSANGGILPSFVTVLQTKHFPDTIKTWFCLVFGIFVKARDVLYQYMSFFSSLVPYDRIWKIVL